MSWRRRSALSMSASRSPSYSVEQMLPDDEAADLIIGTATTFRFGPILLVGMGGVYVEVLNDKRVALAPTSPEQVEAMIRSLRGSPLLTGARGRSPIDISAAAQAGAAISERLQPSTPRSSRWR